MRAVPDLSDCPADSRLAAHSQAAAMAATLQPNEVPARGIEPLIQAGGAACVKSILKPILVYCAKGARGQYALTYLQALGDKNLKTSREALAPGPRPACPSRKSRFVEPPLQ